jgi:hypothetical protein
VSRAAATARLAAALAAATLACGERAAVGGPRPLAIEPASGPEGQAVPVVVRGESFRPAVHTDYGDGGASTVDARFTVRLGSAPLQGVKLQPDGTITATVPETLPPGTYDLTVEDPGGRAGVLPAAYRVLGLEEAAQLVAAYRIDPTGPQQAMRPFVVTVTALDASGARVEGYAGPVTLSDLSGTVVPAVAGLFVDGRFTGFVEVRAPRAADVLHAEDPLGRSGDSAPFDVAPVPAARLSFATPPRALQAGGCSEEITVALEDAYGLPTVAAAPLSIALAPSAADVTLFADPACAVPLGAAVLAAGEGTLALHVRATRDGASALDVSAPGLGGASQPIAVAPGPPAAIAFVTSPRVVSSGACSDPIAVELRDAWGNPAPQPALAIALSAAPAGVVALFADGACGTPAASVPLGADARATFRFGGLAVGLAQVTAGALGLSAAQDATVVPPGGAARLVFVTPPRSTPAGACSAELSVQAQDSFGTPVGDAGGLVVAFASTADRTFHLDPACGAPVSAATVPPGESQVRIYVRGTVAQVAPVDASSAGVTAATQEAAVVAAAPDRIEFATPPVSFAAGTCSPPLSARLLDAYGNVAPSPGAALAVSADPADGLAFHLDAACGGATTSVPFPAGATEATFHVTGTVARDVAVTVSAGLAADAAQVATVLPALRDRLALVSGGGQVVTAGTCSDAVTLESRDAFGNPSGAGIARTLALTVAGAPDLELFAGPGCSGAPVGSLALPSGTSQAVFSYRGRTAGSSSVAVAVGGWATVDVPLGVLPAAREALALLSGGGQAVEAGACSGPVTLQTRDAFGNPSGAGGAVAVQLAVPGAPGDLGLFEGPGCSGAPASALALADGVSEGVFSFRGTTAGPFAVDARVAGWVPLAVPEAITGGPAALIVWSVVPSPQYQGVPFDVRLAAEDAYGNAADAFTGTATLSSTAGVALECAAACSGPLTTGPFVAGVWAGQIGVRPGATAVTVTAASDGLSGTSAPFDVVGAGPRSPPLARITATPAVITSGQSVLLDATGSFDYQALDQDLRFSWDLTGTAGQPAGDPAQGWTAFDAAPAVSHVYTCGAPAGCTLFPRVAVRDPDGDLGYATVRVVVLSSGADLCVVETAADVDDGATSCGGYRGQDGALSLAEALRLSSNKRRVITFSGPMTISGAGSYAIQGDLSIVAPPGVVLDGKSLAVVGTPNVLVAGLELRNQLAPIVFPNASQITLEDVRARDAAGIQAYGTATLRRVRMTGCSGFCVQTDDPAGTDTLTVEDSEFEGGGVAIDLSRCARRLALDLRSSTFAGFATAVDVRCPGETRIRHATFHGNGTAIAYGDGSHHVLQNAIFTGQTVAIATCAPAVTFDAREYHLLSGNAAGTSCVTAADPGTLAGQDPLYVFEARNDLRLLLASPARNTPLDLTPGASGLDLNGPAPGRFSGPGPDRGGREGE